MIQILVPFSPSLLWIQCLASLSFLLSLSCSMHLSSVDGRLCRSLCQCTSKTVDCNHQDALSFLPTQVSREYNQLHISHALFHDKGLVQANFSHLSHLLSLKIVYSRLRSLGEDTFWGLDSLQYMDLSHNTFSQIAPRAFAGLRLVNLYLERNQGGLEIPSDMFTGLRVTNLYLRSNGIVRISVTPFQGLAISKLYLFNNSIESVDRSFAPLFGSPHNLLDLTKNPLHCSCALSWFPDLILRWKAVPSFVKITCHSPPYLQERPLSTLPREEFPCETPTISKISVDVSRHFLHLVCHAKGAQSGPPRISWTEMRDRVQETPFQETPSRDQLSLSSSSSSRDQSSSSSVSVNVSRLSGHHSFLCRSWNEINSSTQVLVRLSFGQDFLSGPSSSSSSSSILGGGKEMPSQGTDDEDPVFQPPRVMIVPPPGPPSDTHFLFSKQFSILQMIGAVVGTFSGVVLLIFLVCCTQEHFLRRESVSNPYWTILPPLDTKTLAPSRAPFAPPSMVPMIPSQDYDLPHPHPHPHPYPQESNHFLQSYHTDLSTTPHYVDIKPTNFFSTIT